jgi:hypothetical protein
VGSQSDGLDDDGLDDDGLDDDGAREHRNEGDPGQAGGTAFGDAEAEAGLESRDPRADGAAEPRNDATEAASDPGAASTQLPPGVAIRLALGSSPAERGQAVAVRGAVSRRGRACAGAAVRLELIDASRGRYPLGTLVCDDRGRFSGRLVIPWDVAIGPSELQAGIVETTTCGR